MNPGVQLFLWNNLRLFYYLLVGFTKSCPDNHDRYRPFTLNRVLTGHRTLPLWLFFGHFPFLESHLECHPVEAALDSFDADFHVSQFALRNEISRLWPIRCPYLCGPIRFDAPPEMMWPRPATKAAPSTTRPLRKRCATGSRTSTRLSPRPAPPSRLSR